MAARLMTTTEAARAVGINRITLQKWIRNDRVKPPRLTIRNGRAVRLWSPSDVRALKDLKRRRDAMQALWKKIKANVAAAKEQRKIPRQGRLDFRK